MKIPKSIKEIIDYIENSGFEVFIVGGAVRDYLLGKKPLDYDLTTNALPDELKKIFKKKEEVQIFDVGIKHGTLTLCYKNHCMEITTYRSEEGYLDLRHPDNVVFITSIAEDLRRRDFTINAICYNNKIYDPLNGQIDLKNKIIRAIGNPDIRFNEDALRIMRGIRFAAVLGFEIEKNTKASIFKNKYLLENISIERIREEFDKILMSKNANDIFVSYYDVFFEFFREFGSIYNINMNFNILDKLPNNIIFRLTGFFYTIIKNTLPFSSNLDNKIIIKNTLMKFKYPANIVYKVSTILENLNTELQIERIFIKMQLLRLGIDNLTNILSFKIVIMKMNNEDYSQLTNILLIIEDIINNNDVYSIEQVNINGKDLVSLGIKEGPEIGRILNDILFLIINEKLVNNNEIIINLIKNEYLLKINKK